MDNYSGTALGRIQVWVTRHLVSKRRAMPKVQLSDSGLHQLGAGWRLGVFLKLALMFCLSFQSDLYLHNGQQHESSKPGTNDRKGEVLLYVACSECLFLILATVDGTG